MTSATQNDDSRRADALAAAVFPRDVVALTHIIEGIDHDVLRVASLSVPTPPDADQLIVRAQGGAPRTFAVAVAGHAQPCGLVETVDGWYAVAQFAPPRHFWVAVEVRMSFADGVAPATVTVGARSTRDERVSMVETTILPCGRDKIEIVEPPIEDGAAAIRELLEAGQVAAALDAFVNAASDPNFLHGSIDLAQDVLAAAAADADVRIESNALILLAVLSS